MKPVLYISPDHDNFQTLVKRSISSIRCTQKSR